MTESILDADELTTQDRTLVEEAETLAGQINAVATLDNWLTVLGPAIMVGRRWAMRHAHTNVPRGQLYAVAFAAWKQSRPNIGKLDPNTVTDTLWLLEDAERMAVLAELRQPSAANPISDAASPITCRQRVRKELTRREQLAKAKDGDPRETPAQRLKRERDELKGAVADLEERNAHLEGKVDGGTFDLERDKLEAIKAVVDGVHPKPTNVKRLRAIAGFATARADVIDEMLKVKAGGRS